MKISFFLAVLLLTVGIGLNLASAATPPATTKTLSTSQAAAPDFGDALKVFPEPAWVSVIDKSRTYTSDKARKSSQRGDAGALNTRVFAQVKNRTITGLGFIRIFVPTVLSTKKPDWCTTTVDQHAIFEKTEEANGGLRCFKTDIKKFDPKTFVPGFDYANVDAYAKANALTYAGTYYAETNFYYWLAGYVLMVNVGYFNSAMGLPDAKTMAPGTNPLMLLKEKDKDKVEVWREKELMPLIKEWDGKFWNAFLNIAPKEVQIVAPKEDPKEASKSPGTKPLSP